MSVVSAVLVGRDDTREELRAALATTAGGLGACLVISGPAGIGKSRLLEAVVDDAAALDLAVAAGRATELDRAAPLTTLASTLRGLRPPVFPAAGNRPDSPHRIRWRNDFDWTGVRVTAATLTRYPNAVPWRMGCDEYLSAADAGPKLVGSPACTPWDKSLADAMRRTRLAVMEERLLDRLLGDLSGSVRDLSHKVGTPGSFGGG